jgi:LEA14-like dessication related protein
VKKVRAMLVALFTLTFGSLVFAADLIAPKISIADLHSPTLTVNGAQLICTVRVENWNTVALPVTAGNVALKLADAPAATAQLSKPVTIPPRQFQNVDLPVSVTMSAAASWLPAFLGSDAFTMPFDVEGYVDIAGESPQRVHFHQVGNVMMVDGELVIEDARSAL